MKNVRQHNMHERGVGLAWFDDVPGHSQSGVELRNMKAVDWARSANEDTLEKRWSRERQTINFVKEIHRRLLKELKAMRLRNK